MTIYGYVRSDIPCPTVDQFTVLSEYECDKVFLEISEVKEDTELQQLLARVQSGDTVVTTAVSVFGKTLSHLSLILETFRERGVRFVSVQEEIDTDINHDFYHYLTLFITNERETKRLIARQSIELSRSKGGKIGRPTLTEETVQKVQQLYKERKTLREIASECGISLGSARKYVLEMKQKNAG